MDSEPSFKRHSGSRTRRREDGDHEGSTRVPSLDERLDDSDPKYLFEHQQSEEPTADQKAESNTAPRNHSTNSTSRSAATCMNENPPPCDEKSWLVDFDGPDDPDKPMNLPNYRKILIVLLTSLNTFAVSFGSSVFSTCIVATAAEFDISQEVMILGVSLYVLGFAFGPIIWGPLSERFGRYYPVFTGLAICVIFQIPVAVAQNVETIFVCRFFAGVFGSAPFGLSGAIYTEIFSPVNRGLAYAAFSAGVFLGPTLGPVFGSLLTENYGWRWTAWTTMIISGVFTTLGILLVPETSTPIILQQKAKRRRLETKEWAWHSKLDESPSTFKSLGQKYMLKPFQMLSCEPILVAISAYVSLVYSILYLILFSYPYAFGTTRGWTPIVASLPFLSLMIGICISCAGMAIYFRTLFARKLLRKTVTPEDRLPPMIVGGFVLPIGLFWFAWTSSPNINYWPQVIAGVFIGSGITSVFFSGTLYVVDVYLTNSASALGANAFIRGVSAAGFPLFATYMYEGMGVAWATSLLGFVCIGMVPIPILFYYHGHKLREKGTYTFAL